MRLIRGDGMAVTKASNEMTALQAVYAALKDLEHPMQLKILASVAVMLDLPGSATDQKQSGTTVEGERDRQTSHTNRPLSLVEVKTEKAPKTGQHMIVLFAYHREKHENKPRFSRHDLEGYFAKARENPPKNYDRDFNEVVKKGWIHEEGDESYITSRGIELVESGFPTGRKGNAKRPRVVAKKGSARSKKVSKRG
jgi:hypothetical protein